MYQVKALILRAAGINCDMETVHALESAGAAAESVHINRLIEDKALLDKYHIVIVPGGFSYGDDVSAGIIFANQIRHHLYEALRKFVDDGKLVLGICNGFQVLIKSGLLDSNGSQQSQPRVTITTNDSGKFEDRWVYLQPQTDRCVFIEPGRRIYLPVAHGEGKLVTIDDSYLKELQDSGSVAFTYVDKDGQQGDYPVNPNGSMGGIAGLTDSTGRVMGLMPHPERFVRATQHPHWTRLKNDEPGDGMTIFNNAVNYVRENF
jgi:phosphoribosylformylglycinamidine synthase